MPYQDIDESEVVRIPDPNVIERWGRKIFVEDWGLKLLALAITLFLWFAVTGVNQPKTVRRIVQLNYIRAADMDISNDPPRSIEVSLTGSKERLENISAVDLVGTVDVSDRKAGEHVVKLSPETVNMALSSGVKVDVYEPGMITVRLEPKIVRHLEIEVRIEGKPAEGYEVYGTQSKPASITVRGPASLVNAIVKAPTQSISVDGRKETFTAPHVAIDLQNRKLEVLDDFVDVLIEIGEKQVEKSFSGPSTPWVAQVISKPAQP